MKTRELRSNVFATYTTLRVGMGVIAFSIPLLLWGGGRTAGYHLQGSICAYYHTPMRDYFVGAMFAAGALLYLYKGFSWQENYALNLAGVLAILIAIIPADPPGKVSAPPAEMTASTIAPTASASGDPDVHRSRPGQIHNVISVAFLLTLAYVCLFRSADTLQLIASRVRKNSYYYIYKIIGVCMIATPPIVYYIANHGQRHVSHSERVLIFYVECAAMWAFGVYWMLKTKEISESMADRTTDAAHALPVARPVHPLPHNIPVVHAVSR